jgi:DNA-binding transcriptional regulator LsrR (DeoR family)
MSLTERARRKRLKDLDRIKHLYYRDGLSLNEMYQRHGIAPLYARKVLTENGYEVVSRVNQFG